VTRRSALLPLLLAAPLLALMALARPAFAQQTVLTLGRISDDPKKHYAQLKPLLDYVVPRLADAGIREGRILMARDRAQMVSHLRHHRVDWVTETAGMAMQLQALSGARPLLLTKRGGASQYRSLVIVRAGAPMRSLDDLAGRSIAFEHIASTSAYLLPAAQLLRAGLSLQPLATLGDQPAGQGVGYLFAHSEANIAIWVDKGLVDAGAISSLGWDNPDAVPPSLRTRLRVVHASPPAPRALELTRAGLDPAVTARLREVLLAAADDPDGAPALRAFFGATDFLPIDDAVRRQLDALRTDMLRVDAEVE
jgi:phosphonate transport system substrate-binding protein